MSTSRTVHADIRTTAPSLVSSALQRLRIGLLVLGSLAGLGWSGHAAAAAAMTVTVQFQGIAVDADGNSQVTVGDTLSYTVDATNTGTVSLTNVVVSDPITTPNSSICATLAIPGDNCHLSGNYVVTAADETAGNISNIASATSNEVGPVASNTVNTPVIARNPTMTVTKSLAGNPSQVAVGDVILYTIFATNTGNLPLHNVVITDLRTTPSTATCATVNLSLSCIFNGNYTVTAADATAGNISNTGSVTSTETPVPIASNTTNTPVVGGPASMSVSKILFTNTGGDSNGLVTAGDTLTFRVDVQNTGSVPLTNVVVSDPLTSPNTITCATVLNGGGHCILDGTYTVTTADETAGHIINTGSATSTQVPGPIASNTLNTPVITRTTSLTVTETLQSATDPDASGTVTAGDVLTFRVQMDNTGTQTLHNVVISDPRLTGASTTTCPTVTGTGFGGGFCAFLGTHTVTAAEASAGQFSTTASATSTEIPGPQSSNTVNTPVFTTGAAMTLSVVLFSFTDSDSNGLVTVGDTLTYTLRAVNTGTVTLNSFAITDPLDSTFPSPLCGPTTLAVGAARSCSFNYTVTAADETTGRVSNTGSATSTEIPTPTSSNTLLTPVITRTTSMSVFKTLLGNADGDSSGTVTVGDILTYRVLMKNTGTQPLNNVVARDSLISPNTITCATVNANGTCVLNGTYTVSAADQTAGSISNTGSATSNEIPGPVTSTVITPMGTANYNLAVQKTLIGNTDPDGNGQVTVGDTLTFRVSMQNTGTRPLNTVVVNDPLTTPNSTGGSCGLAGTINPGGTCVLDGTYTVTGVDASAGQINNTGSATSTEIPGPTASNTLNTPVFTVSTGGHLTLMDVQPSNTDGDHSGSVTLGDVLTYTITAINDGTIALTNVQITDPLLTPNSVTCASLAINANCVLIGTHTVAAADAANGQIFDNPRVTSTELPNNFDTGLITPITTTSGAAMTVGVNLNDYIDTDNSGTTTAGDQFHIIVTAINAGSIPLTNVQVNEAQTVPSSTSCANLASGSTCVLTGTYTITASDITNMIITSIGSATSTQVPGPVTFTDHTDLQGGPISRFALLKVTGDGQTGAPGTTLAIPLKVRMLGASNTPLSGQEIHFVVVEGSAHFTTIPTVTDGLGEASTQLVLGNTPGPVVVYVAGKDQPSVVFVENITGLVTATAALTIVSGNNQSLPIDTTSAPLVVQLTSNNLPVANATIIWSGTNATLTSATSLTDVNGRATNTATLPAVGAASVSALSSSPAAGPVTFSFNGSIANVSGLTPAQLAVATALDNACPALAALGTLTPAQQDLLQQCQALIAANPGEVRNALDQMLPHDALLQTNAGIQIATAQFDNIKARIAALRSGAHGAHFGGLSFSSPSGTLPVGTLGDSLLGFADDKSDDNQKQEVGSAFDRWGFFASGNFGRGSADPRQATPGYGFHTNGITAGVDYRFNDQLIAGVSAGYAKYSSNVDNVGGGLNTSGWSLSGYSTFFRQDSWYVDGVLTWGSNSYDIARRIIYTLTTGTGSTTVNQTAKSNSSGTTLAAAGTFGRDFSKGPWSFGPYFRGTWTRTSFGSYQEVLQSGNGNGLGLAVQSRDVTAIGSVLGAKLNYASSQSWGVLMPHAEVEWEHEFRSSPDSITANFLQDPTATPIQLNGDAIDTDFFRLGLGMSFQFTGGRSGFIYYEKTLGLTGITQDNLTLGIRMEF